MAKTIFNLVLTIFIVIQVLTKVNAANYEQDESYIDEDNNGKRRSSLAIARGPDTIIEDYNDMSDSEYLHRAIKTLSTVISSLRRNVMELHRSDLADIKKTVERLAEAQSLSTIQSASSRSQASVVPQSSVASLLGLNNPGTLAGAFLGQGGLGIAQANGGLGNYGAIAAGSPLRDELNQLVDTNLAQQTAGQLGQLSSLQNQAIGQLLSGYKDASGVNTGLTTGLGSTSSNPPQIILSRLG